MAPESRKYGAKMALLTEERYALCAMWRQLTQFWPHELVALNRNSPVLLKIFPQLEVIWLKAEADAPFEQLLQLVDGLAVRDGRCQLIVCVDKATPAEIKELMEHGTDEVLFIGGVMAEPMVLHKTLIALEARRERSEALKAHIIRHQKALQSKSEFVAWLSHEIRTPMNGVLGMIELFPQNGLTAEQQDMLDVMGRSGKRVVDLLSEVLDVSRIEAGKMKRAHHPFQLRRLIEDCLSLYARDANRRGLIIGKLVEADVPDVLSGDERKLSQILNNLISNAVKYTVAGHVLIKVRIQAWEGDGCRLWIEVQDSGHGIAADEISKVFAPFEQTHSAHLSRSHSSGLGLSLTKSLVELLGGSIHLESRLGEGSTFSCLLPFQVVEKSVQPLPTDRPSIDFHGARVLVVDDDPVNLKVAEKQLKRLQAETTVVTSGVDALETLEKKHFDLIFVDCQMPHMDGFELVKIMRGLPQLIPGTPVIALTALGRDEDREKALSHGFSDFLAKPAQLEDIQKLLGRWLPFDLKGS